MAEMVFPTPQLSTITPVELWWWRRVSACHTSPHVATAVGFGFGGAGGAGGAPPCTWHAAPDAAKVRLAAAAIAVARPVYAAASAGDPTLAASAAIQRCATTAYLV